MNLLNADTSLLVIIDIQEKLVSVVKNKIIAENAAKLVKTANLLNIPIIVTEQYPQGLGSTLNIIKQELNTNNNILTKTTFSAFAETNFQELLKKYNKKQIIICGIEAHICVHQTSADLKAAGYDVFFVKNASASRTHFEFEAGIERMKENEISISTLEIVLFELLKTSKNIHFKEIQSLIK